MTFTAASWFRSTVICVACILVCILLCLKTLIRIYLVWLERIKTIPNTGNLIGGVGDIEEINTVINHV